MSTMPPRPRVAVPVTALLLAAALGGTNTSAATPSSPVPISKDDSPSWACPAPTEPRQARCLVRYSPSPSGLTDSPGVLPEGYSPQDLRAAYQLPRHGSAERTVAIVDAFDNPRADADLASYRARYHLPPCSIANGCLSKVNQRGAASPLPPSDTGWGLEIALDLDMVSATCPDCHLLLVEADSANVHDLATAVSTAVRLGADIVSNSYGLDEFHGMRDFAKDYQHPGVPILAAAGDFGFGAASFPAVLRSVMAVGGTQLTRTSQGWSERAWDYGGSGCSAYISKPAWQPNGHCAMRLVADISAVADPATGPAFYDTFGLGEDGGWMVGGGTSASTPLIAGMIGLAGNAARASSPQFLYQHRDGFQDIVGGSNGYCGHDYLCTALPGYDGPTGLGSPRGLGGL